MAGLLDSLYIQIQPTPSTQSHEQSVQGLRGLYSGFFPAVLGSSLSWGLYFFFYSRAKHRYQKDTGEQLGPGLHLASAAEAGTLVCLFTNPVWLVKTRLQLQVPGSAAHQPYSGFFDASRTIFRDEGWRALYKGLGPGLLLVSHGAIQFTAYEEARKFVIKSRNKQCNDGNIHGDEVLTSADYVAMGAFSKIFAALSTYPYQVIRARVQQRPNSEGVPKYRDSYHALTETLRFEGIRGLYKGIVPNLLRNVPASSITFLVYENVLKFFK
ncbi:folate transporter 1, chloroplastic isoform X4 [Cryptomeria japonica]|uniref:folate transporter 1, chloroplastic isoform X4 n=1 Tax=Cryptomeria japonica TaxID=3369 RepID=UPI0027DA38BA|nr:folate transporter 1, chloroplastic isoform X4 [Cryptomeria japonica]